MTPVLRDPELPLPLPPRTVVRITLARDRANWRDDVPGEFFEPPDALLVDPLPPPLRIKNLYFENNLLKLSIAGEYLLL